MIDCTDNKIDNSSRFEQRNSNFMALDPMNLMKRNENYSVKLRKDQRKDFFQKKRLRLDDRTEETEDENEMPNFSLLNPKEKLLAIYSYWITADTHEKIVYSLKSFRRTLKQFSKSTELLPELREEYIDKLTSFIGTGYPDSLESEAVWTISNLASMEKPIVDRLVSSNLIPILIESLQEFKPLSNENAILAIGNICIDQNKYRDILVNVYHLHEILLDYLVKNWNSLPMATLESLAWCSSNLIAYKTPVPYSIYEKIITIFKYLIKIENAPMQKYILEGLNTITDGDNKRIQLVINAGFLQKIISALASNNKSLSVSAIKTIGNISSGDDHHTQLLLDSNILDVLASQGGSNILSIRKDVAYTLSNIAGGTKEQLGCLIHHPVCQRIMKLLVDKHFEVKREASFIIRNIANVATDNDILFLVEQNVFIYFRETLNEIDPKIIINLLEFVERALDCGRTKAGSSDPQLNISIGALHLANCIERIENLYNHMNLKIRAIVEQIIKKYFDLEDNECNMEDSSMPEIFEFS
ncbi:unnamed protein product [Blepharisma stoltei]|uniref:Importin subunit alpha n=1 Tax=Blepharisma stoltei TaxID=1481888 RepID=A0AAU9ICW6_9CILI|nr:unnamed protein product [Blepharisma stoltei]